MTALHIMALLSLTASFASAMLLAWCTTHAAASFTRRHERRETPGRRTQAVIEEGAGSTGSTGATIGTCQSDSSTWSNSYGSCQAYAPGAMNHQYCLQDGAVVSCPVACSEFTGPGFDVAGVAGVACTSAYCGSGICEVVGEGESATVLCQCGALTTLCLAHGQPCITMNDLNGTCFPVDSGTYAAVGLQCWPALNVTALQSHCQAEWNACDVTGRCSFDASTLSTPVDAIWKSGGDEQQALLLCGHIELAADAAQNVCRSTEIGLISRVVLETYCHVRTIVLPNQAVLE